MNLFPAYALPSPGSVAKSFREEMLAERLVNDIIASLSRLAVGFVIATTLGNFKWLLRRLAGKGNRSLIE